MDAKYLMHPDSNLVFEVTVCSELCSLINSPRSLTVYLLLKYAEWQQVIDLEIDPRHYEDVDRFADDYLVTKILSKSPSLPLEIDTKQQCYLSWLEAENRCKRVNDSLYKCDNNVGSFLNKVEDIVATILGPLTKSDLDYVEQHCRHGNGAATGVKSHGLIPPDKFSSETTMTANLYPFARALMGPKWSLIQEKRTIVKGGRCSTVPKNAKIDRGVEPPPILNTWYTLSVGSLIRQKLTRFGIDLEHQAVNQKLAQRAASRGLATIDFKQASDSWAYSVVRRLVGSRWFHLLDIGRVDFSTWDGVTYHENQKFSAMGTGFTFELESLLFLACALAVTPIEEWGDVHIHGDDLIMPAAYASLMIEPLSELGVMVNLDKSYLAGNFYESCGADYFKGVNVRPFFLRDIPVEEEGDSISFQSTQIPYSLRALNALRLYAWRRGEHNFCSSRFKPLWKSILTKVPKDCRYPVPLQMGDTGVISTYDEYQKWLNRKGLSPVVPYVTEVVASQRRPGKFENIKTVLAGAEGEMVKHLQCTPVKITSTKDAALLALLFRVQGSLSYEHFTRGTELAAHPDMTKGRFIRRGLFGRRGTSWSIIRDWPSSIAWV